MDYREKNKGFITASKLKLFLDSPLLYKAVYVDNVDLSGLKKSTALEVGTMVDKFLLTPDEFNKEYSFQVGSLKAELLDFCHKAGIKLTGYEKVDDLKKLIYGDKKVLTDAQEQLIMGIKEEIERQPLWSMCRGKYMSQVELTHKYKNLNLKGTLDRFFIDEDEAIIRDLKTTSQMYYNAYSDNTQFYHELSTRDPYHYKLQMAMYVWLVKQTYPDIKDITVIIDAIGTSDPYFYQAIMLDVNELETVWETQVVPLLEDLNNLEEGIVQWTMPVEVNRNKLSSNQYYRVGSDDCIQKEFEYIGTEIPKPDETPEEFDRENL